MMPRAEWYIPKVNAEDPRVGSARYTGTANAGGGAALACTHDTARSLAPLLDPNQEAIVLCDCGEYVKVTPEGIDDDCKD
jgi:hypothetical protein